MKIKLKYISQLLGRDIYIRKRIKKVHSQCPNCRCLIASGKKLPKGFESAQTKCPECGWYITRKNGYFLGTCDLPNENIDDYIDRLGHNPEKKLQAKIDIKKILEKAPLETYEMAILFLDGYSLREIAQRCGVSYQTVVNKLRELAE